MKFAFKKPIDISYDEKGDVLYVTYSREQSETTLELNGWPLVLADVNAEGKIIGVECVGAKQIISKMAKIDYPENKLTVHLQFGMAEIQTAISNLRRGGYTKSEIETIMQMISKEGYGK